MVWVLLALILFGGIGVAGYYFLYLRNAVPTPQVQPEAAPPPAPAPATQTTAPTPGENPAGAEQTATEQPASGETAQPGATAGTEQPASVPATPAPKTEARKPERRAEPAVKPTPALKYGKIFVSSSPQGAQITVDGRSDPDWVTPRTVEGLAAGSHTVILSREGFSPARRSIAVEAGRTAAPNVQLGGFHAPPEAPRAVHNPFPGQTPPPTGATGIAELTTHPPPP